MLPTELTRLANLRDAFRVPLVLLVQQIRSQFRREIWKIRLKITYFEPFGIDFIPIHFFSCSSLKIMSQIVDHFGHFGTMGLLSHSSHPPGYGLAQC